MRDLYPGALWRPLSAQQSEPVIGIPRILVWHTMVGNLRSTEAMFRRDGYGGVESTFGLGGTSDGSLDGIAYQWQRLSRQADAQMAANAFATSIECSDGGNWKAPFSEKQVEWSIAFGIWWCKETGRPAVKAGSWDGVGLGYHKMFPQWTGGPRECPGPARARQLETEIWPDIFDGLKHVVVKAPSPPVASAAPPFPLKEGEFFGPRHNAGIPAPEEGLRLWERQMNARGWTLSVNGQFDEETERVVRQFQKEKGLGVDGKIGLQTWNAAWNAKVT